MSGTYYRTCPDCGCNLDPGEICDCKKDNTPICHELMEALRQRLATQKSVIILSYDDTDKDDLAVLIVAQRTGDVTTVLKVLYGEEATQLYQGLRAAPKEQKNHI